MAKYKRINDIRKYLIDENIYTPKDEITLFLLENTYSQFMRAVKDVNKNGDTIQVTDSSGKLKKVINPSFRNQMELHKELFKLIQELYLTPRSRKSKKDNVEDKTNPFIEMLKDINEKSDD